MRLFEEATKKLGYHPFVIPAATVSQTYTNPDGETLNACQYCGFCSSNYCEYGAKADPLMTVIPTELKTGNFGLRTHAKVTRILHDGEKATGVLYQDIRTGEYLEQPADLIALTSYTFNNVRLLLLSEIGKPYDPVIGTGVIGKNFTDHHHITLTIGLFDDKKFNLYATTRAYGSVITDFTGLLFDHSNLNFIHGGDIELRLIGSGGPITVNVTEAEIPQWGREFKNNQYSTLIVMLDFLVRKQLCRTNIITLI